MIPRDGADLLRPFSVKAMNHRNKKGSQSSFGMIASTVEERALE